MQTTNAQTVKLIANYSNSIWQYRDSVEVTFRETSETFLTVNGILPEEFLTAVRYFIKNKVSDLSELPAREKTILKEIAESLQTLREEMADV